MAKKLEAITITRGCIGPKGAHLEAGSVLKIGSDIGESDALFLVRLGKAQVGAHKVAKPSQQSKPPQRQQSDGGEDGKDGEGE